MNIKTYLKENKLITDGSFGTYYADKYSTNEMPELANSDSEKSQRVIEIHKEYINSGAKLIRTNTFASNTELLNTDIESVKQMALAIIESFDNAMLQRIKDGYEE